MSANMYIFKAFKVEMEVWKKSSRKRKGMYVSPSVMDLSLLKRFNDADIHKHVMI